MKDANTYAVDWFLQREEQAQSDWDRLHKQAEKDVRAAKLEMLTTDLQSLVRNQDHFLNAMENHDWLDLQAMLDEALTPTDGEVWERVQQLKGME